MTGANLVARLTRRSRSNFYYAFLALPRPRRDALYAVYAFCRTVDDIADLGAEQGTDPRVLREELERWRCEVARCYEPGPGPEHPIAQRLASAVKEFRIPREPLEAIIDGVAMDVAGVRFETAADHPPYCLCGASSAGLASRWFFGFNARRGPYR